MGDTPKSYKFVKAEDIVPEHGLVLGRSMICSVNDEPFFDDDNQHIPAEVMLTAAV